MPFNRIPVFPRKSAIVLALALTMAGCAQFQGFYFSRPVTARAIDALLTARVRRVA